MPYVLSNLFAGQQKSNRFCHYDAWKSALVLYWSTGGKLCDDHCQFRFFLHERSRFPQMGCGAKILKTSGFRRARINVAELAGCVIAANFYMSRPAALARSRLSLSFKSRCRVSTFCDWRCQSRIRGIRKTSVVDKVRFRTLRREHG